MIELPDWSGEVCAVLGCGPSARAEQIRAIRDRVRVIVVNCAWTLVPDADLLYACDSKWWEQERRGYGQNALRDFAGLKVTQSSRNAEGVLSKGYEHPDVHVIELRHKSELVTEPGVIGSCVNGGFQATNVGYHCGVRRFLWFGFDNHAAKGLHFHGSHPHGMSNPSPSTWNRWNGALHDAEASIREAGVEIVNCTPGTALTLFPRMSADEAFEQWRVPQS